MSGQVIGYWYKLFYHMGLCRGPVNGVVEVRSGDKTAWNIELTNDIILPLYKPELFGGEKAEGGVMGAFQLMMGKPDQVAPAELNFYAGFPQPGFRRMCTVYFNGFIGALNPYPKPWSFRVRRTSEGWDGDCWYPEKVKIVLTRPMSLAELTSSPEIHAMNPAHIIYECLTNREWGRGLNRLMLNDASFRAAADTLFTENFGMCMRWTRTDSIESFVQSIIDHIGAVLRPNRQTGELELKLIRSDYVVSELPLFQADEGLLEITEASVATLPSIINHVIVKYTDPITGKEASIGVHNLAGVQGSQGEVNTLTKDYPGVCTPELAARVAQRDLRASSTILRRFSFKLDRRGQKVRPGDAIRIRDLARNIPDMVVRVGKVSNGNLLKGEITITAVQDVFGLPASSYVATEPPRWEPPKTSPCIGYNRPFEMPYFLLARTMSAADLDYVKPEAGYLGTVVELGGRPLNGGYKLAIREGDPTADDMPDEDDDYCPTVPPGWAGGDCVKIVMSGEPEHVEFEWTMTMGTPHYPEAPSLSDYTRGALSAQSAVPFGSVTGEGAYERFGQFLTNTLSEWWPEPYTGIIIAGNADENFTKFVFTVDGVDYTIPDLVFTTGDQLPGFEGVWTNSVFPNLIPLPALGAVITCKVYQGSSESAVRVVEPCCICADVEWTITCADLHSGEPPFDREFVGYQMAIGADPAKGTVFGTDSDRLSFFSYTGALDPQPSFTAIQIMANGNEGISKVTLRYAGVDYELEVFFGESSEFPGYEGSYYGSVSPALFEPSVGSTVTAKFSLGALCCAGGGVDPEPGEFTIDEAYMTQYNEYGSPIYEAPFAAFKNGAPISQATWEEDISSILLEDGDIVKKYLYWNKEELDAGTVTPALVTTVWVAINDPDIVFPVSVQKSDSGTYSSKLDATFAFIPADGADPVTWTDINDVVIDRAGHFAYVVQITKSPAAFLDELQLTRGLTFTDAAEKVASIQLTIGATVCRLKETYTYEAMPEIDQTEDGIRLINGYSRSGPDSFVKGGLSTIRATNGSSTLLSDAEIAVGTTTATVNYPQVGTGGGGSWNIQANWEIQTNPVLMLPLRMAGLDNTIAAAGIDAVDAWINSNFANLQVGTNSAESTVVDTTGTHTRSTGSTTTVTVFDRKVSRIGRRRNLSYFIETPSGRDVKSFKLFDKVDPDFPADERNYSKFAYYEIKPVSSLSPILSDSFQSRTPYEENNTSDGLYCRESFREASTQDVTTPSGSVHYDYLPYEAVEVPINYNGSGDPIAYYSAEGSTTENAWRDALSSFTTMVLAINSSGSTARQLSWSGFGPLFGLRITGKFEDPTNT